MQNPPEPTRAVGPNEHPAWDHVRAKAELFTALSDRVWATPELNYAEWASAEAHRAALDAQGFRVTTGVAGLPTAMMGEAGQGGPVIAILGEFDALPGLSQEAGTTREQASSTMSTSRRHGTLPRSPASTSRCRWPATRSTFSSLAGRLMRPRHRTLAAAHWMRSNS